MYTHADILKMLSTNLIYSMNTCNKLHLIAALVETVLIKDLI